MYATPARDVPQAAGIGIIGTMKASLALLLVLAGGSFAQKRDAEFNKLADRFFDEAYFKYDPVSGTAAGFHQYDSMLAAGSRAEIDAQVASLKKFESEVDGFGAQGLSPLAAADRDLLISRPNSRRMVQQYKPRAERLRSIARDRAGGD